ncbi:hypothetical protein AKJ16_DCAP08364, partial [Drosera capensis]
GLPWGFVELLRASNCRRLWQQRPACLTPIHCCLSSGDQSVLGTVANVITSLPFIALGINAPRLVPLFPKRKQKCSICQKSFGESTVPHSSQCAQDLLFVRWLHCYPPRLYDAAVKAILWTTFAETSSLHGLNPHYRSLNAEIIVAGRNPFDQILGKNLTNAPLSNLGPPKLNTVPPEEGKEQKNCVAVTEGSTQRLNREYNSNKAMTNHAQVEDVDLETSVLFTRHMQSGHGKV